MFIAASLIVAKRWNQFKCSLGEHFNKQINKTWYIHTMEYYPALKRKTFPTRATTKMNLEDIMLSKISQSLKDKYCMISLKCGIG